MISSKNTLRLNLPTILTLSRIVLIPLFIVITPKSPVLGVGVFIIASFTDFLDGYLARHSGQITKFGIILDPIADKFLVISALIMLVDLRGVSVWVVTIIIVREFLVTALRVVALSKDIVIGAEFGGKLKTSTQIAAIICLILGRRFGTDIDLYDIGNVLLWLSMVIAVISGVQYTSNFSKRLRGTNS